MFWPIWALKKANVADAVPTPPADAPSEQNAAAPSPSSPPSSAARLRAAFLFGQQIALYEAEQMLAAKTRQALPIQAQKPQAHPRTRKLFNSRVKLTALGCAAGGLLLWLTWPTGGQLMTETCAPNGLIDELSASIHGKRFWRTQMRDIRHQLDEAENWDRTQAEMQQRIDEVIRRANEGLAEIYREHPNLAPPPTNQAYQFADRLRAQADAVERAEANKFMSEIMKRRVPALRRCEILIGEKLN